MSRAPEFTILLPVVRPPDMLVHAVASVQAQRRGDFELFVVCDGAPAETVAAAEALAANDQRIRVRAFPKGERHGEAHRAEVMREASGRLVAQIGDDDLWLPDHLDALARLLARADFGSLLQTYVQPDGRLSVLRHADLGDPRVRERMQAKTWNFFGPTEAGWRMSAYRALPTGWSPAPRDLPTDLFMWRKFLALPDARFATRFAFTALKFGATDWNAIPIAERSRAIADWADRLGDPAALRWVRAEMRRLAVQHLSLRCILRAGSQTPQLVAPLLAAKLREGVGRRWQGAIHRNQSGG